MKKSKIMKLHHILNWIEVTKAYTAPAVSQLLADLPIQESSSAKKKSSYFSIFCSVILSIFEDYNYIIFIL
jgi:hypothetical protein